MDIAQTHELSHNQMSTMNNQSEVQMVRSRRVPNRDQPHWKGQKQGTEYKQCKKCESYHDVHNRCPALGQTHLYCKTEVKFKPFWF